MYCFLPLMRGHPSIKATFLMQKGWPHKRGSTVPYSWPQVKWMSPNTIEHFTQSGCTSCQTPTLMPTCQAGRQFVPFLWWSFVWIGQGANPRPNAYESNTLITKPSHCRPDTNPASIMGNNWNEVCTWLEFGMI